MLSLSKSRNTEVNFHCPKLKQEIDQKRVFWSFLGPQSSKLDDSSCIGKLTQSTTIFMFYERVSSASSIKKISVKIGPKIEQGWILPRKCKPAKEKRWSAICDLRLHFQGHVFIIFNWNLLYNFFFVYTTFQLNSSKQIRLYMTKKSVESWRNNSWEFQESKMTTRNNSSDSWIPLK